MDRPSRSPQDRIAHLALLGEVAASVVHEINNPLSVITGRASSLRDKAARGEVAAEEVERVAAQIELVAIKIARIVKTMRELTQDNSSEPFRVISVADLLHDAAEFVRAKYVAAGIVLELVPPGEEARVECRPVQLLQVTLNLLQNSFDAIRDARGDRWVRFGAAISGGQLELEVVDSGSGIPEPIRARIMEPYFTTKAIGQGSGLGLSVSRKMIEQHGGNLALDTGCANTRLVVRIPLRQNIDAGDVGRVA